MRLRLGDAPYLPLPITDPEAGTVTLSVTFSHRAEFGVDKCEMATLVGIVREALEGSKRLRESERVLNVDIEAYDAVDDSHCMDVIVVNS